MDVSGDVKSESADWCRLKISGSTQLRW